MKINSKELHEKTIMSYCSTALCGLLQDGESWGPCVLLKKKKKKGKHFRKGGNMKPVLKAILVDRHFLIFHSTVSNGKKPAMMKCVNSKSDTMAREDEHREQKWKMRHKHCFVVTYLMCTHAHTHTHTHTYTHIRACYKARNQRSMCSAGNNVCMEGPICQAGRKLV